MYVHIIRVTDTGHLADDGNQAPDARELSLTTFNGKKCKQTIEARDRGFRGDPARHGNQLEGPGSRRKSTIFPQYRVLVAKSANHSLSKVSSSSNTFLLDKSPAIKMEGSNVTTPGSKRHFRSSH